MESFLPYQWTRMSQSSVIAVLQCETVTTEGTQEEEYLLSSNHQTTATAPRNSGCKKRILAPRELRSI